MTWIFWSLVGIFLLVAAAPVWQAYEAFCFHAFDLGIYTRALAALDGNSWNPWISVRGVKIFHDHFDPILIPVALLPGLSPAFKMMACEWISVIGAAGTFLYAYKKRHIDRFSCLFGMSAALFSCAVARAVHYPGHPGTWSLGILSWACLFLKIGDFKKGLLLLAMCFLFKEEYAFYGVIVGCALLAMTRRSEAKMFALFAVLWCVGVFWLRPQFASQYVGYERSALSALTDIKAWADFYGKPEHLRSLLEMFGFLIPLTLGRSPWNVGKKVLLMLLLAMIGVRFVGQWWLSHRSAPVLIAALWLFVPTAQDQLAKWQKIAAAALLVITAAPFFKYARTWASHPYKKHCPADPARLTSLNEAVNFLKKSPDAFVEAEGNFFPALSSLSDGHLVAKNLFCRKGFLLLEHPPLGDPWPLEHEDISRLIEEARQQLTVIKDSDHVFLAERKTGACP